MSDPDVQTVLMTLSTDYIRPVEEPVEPVVLTRGELQSKTCDELKTLCRPKQLPVTGNKGALMDRLLADSVSSNSTDTDSWASALLSCWFMAPSSSTAMETGTHNESNIEEHVEAFFVNHSPFTIEGKRAYGLLCL